MFFKDLFLKFFPDLIFVFFNFFSIFVDFFQLIPFFIFFSRFSIFFDCFLICLFCFFYEPALNAFMNLHLVWCVPMYSVYR